jgi:hypothetical protein
MLSTASDASFKPYFVREPPPPVSGEAPPLRRMQTHLSELTVNLEVIRSAVAVSVAALRHQNCELDEDVASVLQRSVSDRLQDEIDKATQLADSFAPSTERAGDLAPFNSDE